MVSVVALDIDETLIHASECEVECAVVKPTYARLGSYFYYVYTRPGLHELIAACMHGGLKIIIYSAAGSDYVQSVIDLLNIREYICVKPGTKAHAVYDCSNLGPGYLKTFDCVLNDFPSLTLGNLLMIDDSKHNFPTEIESDRVIRVPPWTGTKNDTVLFDIAEMIRRGNFSLPRATA